MRRGEQNHDGKQTVAICPVDSCLIGRVGTSRSLLSAPGKSLDLSFVREFVAAIEGDHSKMGVDTLSLAALVFEWSSTTTPLMYR
jgi:hypothetical protein